MTSLAVALACLVLLTACQDISRIDDDTAIPATSDSAISGAAEPRRYPVGPGRLQPATRTTFPTDDPLAGAADAQAWRLAQQDRAMARTPPNQPVPQSEIDELRRQRMQGEALAASGGPPRPVLGPGSGNTAFAFPAATPSPALTRAISRASAAEASALTR